MKADRMTYLPRLPQAVATACALGVAVGIFVLTSQSPADTSAQSRFVNDVLVGLLGGIEGLYDPQTGEWLGTDIRHWAHTAEFWALGLTVALSVVLARWRKGLLSSGGIALAVCSACSVLDQCHKLLVPARHFDWLDLCMDALGYVGAIATVIAVAGIVRWRLSKKE